MQTPNYKSFLAEYGFTAVLTVGIFILDVYTPAGVVEWVMYAIPLTLTLTSSRPRAPLYFASLVTLLLAIGFVASPPGVTPLYAMINRLLGMGLMWGFALALVNRTQMTQALTDAQAQTVQAESARADAEAAVLGAVAGQRRAEERMREENMRLEGIVQSAMDALISVDEDQKIILFNQAAERMFRWSAGELVGRSMDCLIPERFRRTHGEHIRRFGQSGVTTRKMGALGMITGLRAGGEEFPIEASISQVGVEGKRYFTVILRDITERRRLENELAEREGLLRTIIETEPECVKVLNLDGTVQTMNAAGLAMIEAESSQDILGKDVSRLVVSEFRVPFRELIAKAAQGESGLLEFEIMGLKGGRRWLETHAVPLRGADGIIVSVLGVTRDTTARKQAEASLRRVQGLFEDIVESSKDAIGYASLDGKFVLANQALAKLTGYSQDELLRMNYGELTPDEYRGLQATAIGRVIETGEPAEFEREYIRKDGSRVPVALTVFMVKGEDGKPAGLAAIVRDITERKQAEAAMRQSEERYRRLVQVSPDAIFVLRGDAIMFGNGEGLRLLGATVESQIVGRMLVDFIPVDERAVVRRRLSRVAEEQEQVPLFEQALVRLDGSMIEVEVTVAHYSDQEGPAILVVARDITERKRLQAQLRRTERVAELGTVASGMAHEIGTPMNVILGRAEYLMERTKEEPVRKGLQTIVTQVERITRVMNQLLAFARRRPVEHRALDLRETIEDNLEIFYERLSHNNITVETSFAEDCPLVHADADQICQVLINLVMNAIHAMPNGGTMRLVLAPDRDMVKLTVADTGSGMPQEVIAKVFEPFFTTKEFGKGTGLGLTVVKGIIEEHSGTIHVESEPGKGTVFTIGLPINRDALVTSH
ncbi:MAG: putative Sensor histidine kinase [Nitrospira sp.]|nr:putative Sensor histidine kinase [Nitrospira sp.]